MTYIRYRVPVSIVYDEDAESGQPHWLASEPWFSHYAVGVTPEDALANFYIHCEEEYQWLYDHECDLKSSSLAELNYLRDTRIVL